MATEQLGVVRIARQVLSAIVVNSALQIAGVTRVAQSNDQWSRFLNREVPKSGYSVDHQREHSVSRSVSCCRGRREHRRGWHCCTRRGRIVIGRDGRHAGARNQRLYSRCCIAHNATLWYTYVQDIFEQTGRLAIQSPVARQIRINR